MNLNRSNKQSDFSRDVSRFDALNSNSDFTDWWTDLVRAFAKSGTYPIVTSVNREKSITHKIGWTIDISVRPKTYDALATIVREFAQLRGRRPPATTFVTFIQVETDHLHVMWSPTNPTSQDVFESERIMYNGMYDPDETREYGDVEEVESDLVESGDFDTIAEDALAVLADGLETGEVAYDEYGNIVTQEVGGLKSFLKKGKKKLQKMGKKISKAVSLNKIKHHKAKAEEKASSINDKYGELDGGGYCSVISGGRFVTTFLPRGAKIKGSAKRALEAQMINPIIPLQSAFTGGGSGAPYIMTQLSLLSALADPVDTASIVGVYLKFATPVLQSQAAQFNLTILGPGLGSPLTVNSANINEVIVDNPITIEVSKNYAEVALLFPAQQSGLAFLAALKCTLAAAATLISISGPTGFTIYARPLTAGVKEAEMLF